jgi:putative endonuclease
MEMNDATLNAVLAYLKDNELDIIDEDYTCAAGTVDLIFRDNSELVFATVNSSQGLELPEDSLTKTDREQMEIAAASYLAGHDLPSTRVRFDILGIALVGEGKAWLRHHRDAFSDIHDGDIMRSTKAKRVMNTKGKKPSRTKESKDRGDGR